MTEKASELGMVKTDTEIVLKFAQYCYERLQPATGPVVSEMLSSLTAERDDLHDRCKMYAARIEELVGESDALSAEVERLRGALVPFVQHLKENENMDANAKFVLAPWHMCSGGWLSAMDFYKARAALEERKDG